MISRLVALPSLPSSPPPHPFSPPPLHTFFTFEVKGGKNKPRQFSVYFQVGGKKTWICKPNPATMGELNLAEWRLNDFYCPAFISSCHLLSALYVETAYNNFFFQIFSRSDQEKGLEDGESETERERDSWGGNFL